jgi:hypothetical protein
MQLPTPSVYSSSPTYNSSQNNPFGQQPQQSTPEPLSLDLENDLPSVLQFSVGVNDIGGTLVAELAINQGRVRKKKDYKTVLVNI